MSIAKKDSLLVPYVTNWDTRVTATPSAFSFSSAQASALHDVVQPYVDNYNAMMVARGAGTRSTSLTAAKDTARESMLDVLKPMYAQVQASNTVTLENKELLGVTVRKQPSPIGVPTDIPKIVFDNVIGFTVFMHIEGPEESQHSLPPGCKGVSVYTFTGATPSANDADWKYFGNITRHKMEIDFPSDTPPGSTVWFRACYFNPRNQCGMSCDPISVRLQFVNGWMNQAA